ncbi:MAG: ABC transporter ATP-binding protein, partial [Alphaproteobacteria bacterium]|nr:ABC transporter ATP-binding protein [Alphaproteobacteria bacterium]
ACAVLQFCAHRRSGFRSVCVGRGDPDRLHRFSGSQRCPRGHRGCRQADAPGGAFAGAQLLAGHALRGVAHRRAGRLSGLGRCCARRHEGFRAGVRARLCRAAQGQPDPDHADTGTLPDPLPRRRVLLRAVLPDLALCRKTGKKVGPMIEIRGLEKYFGALQVLKGIDLDVEKGEVLSVIGASGSGKSTTARCITGLLPPTKGKVLFKGEELPASYKSRSKEQLRQAQMIYQMADTALNPKVRICDIIGRPAQFYSGLKGGELKSRVDELLDMIELEPSKYYYRYPTELSGGQKQRIGIARALAANPTFIICDEVTSALDQLVAEGILKLLDRLQKELNLAYMFITHDLATVRSIADEVVVMKQGQVVEQGPKDEMFTPPHHPYTDLLLSSVPEMDPDWLSRVVDERGVDNIGEAADTSA